VMSPASCVGGTVGGGGGGSAWPFGVDVAV
jgi:hypothetical protein